jgi:hypothetical protein
MAHMGVPRQVTLPILGRHPTPTFTTHQDNVAIDSQLSSYASADHDSLPESQIFKQSTKAWIAAVLAVWESPGWGGSIGYAATASLGAVVSC